MKKNSPKPSESELDVLQILWSNGPSTVREIHDQLSADKNVGYTTTLKVLQRMLDKKYVGRSETGKKHIYKALLKEDTTQKAVMKKLLVSAFGGSSLKLVMQALGNKETSKEELKQIRDYIDRIYKEK